MFKACVYHPASLSKQHIGDTIYWLNIPFSIFSTLQQLFTCIRSYELDFRLFFFYYIFLNLGI